MKKKLLFILAIIHYSFASLSQVDNFKAQNYKPVSPSVFSFQQYGDVPIGKYTGVPNISIPLYTISTDELSYPISLNYHAGGIRVNQEASWVGLGWDLSFGSIVQEINDRDDYASSTIHKKPDWNSYGGGVPSNYMPKYSSLYFCTLNPGYSDIVTVNAPTLNHAYIAYSSHPVSCVSQGSDFNGSRYFLPINGNRESNYSTDVVNVPDYDSEPDIFSANFNGHSIKFIRDNNYANQILVLNKLGYQVSRVGNNYKIIVPSGEEYHFELANTITGGTSQPHVPFYSSSIIFYLTKIVTKNKKNITFEYVQNGVYHNYPGLSQKKNIQYTTPTSTYLAAGSHLQDYEGYVGYSATANDHVESYSYENRTFLNRIVFPDGTLTATRSSRDDFLQGQKLDEISINSATRLINRFTFSYSYLTSVSSNVYTPANYGSQFGAMPTKRLKLSSLSLLSGGSYDFTYNTTQLPAKNSFAQDFWGFYNGQISNTSFIPNPGRLNSDQLANVTGLADNGNNNSAHETYCQAGILTWIKYPTGGKTNYLYELNKFNNYWVPDFATTANSISSGNGLRVKSVLHYESDAKLSRRIDYEYTGGKCLQKLQIGRTYPVNDIFIYSSTTGEIVNRSMIELSSKGFYSSNSLSSGVGVGYDQVTVKEIDNGVATNGKTEYYFVNNPDKLNTTASTSAQGSIALPSIKNTDIPGYCENGSLIMQKIFNNSSLVKKIENTYQTNLSNVNYGARCLSYTTICLRKGAPFTSAIWYYYPKVMIGYYPIYDFDTRLTSTKNTNYDLDGNSLETVENYGYDGYGQFAWKQNRSSTGEYIEENYEHAYEYFNRSGNNSLWAANRLTEITGIKRQRRNSDYSQPRYIYTNEKEYTLAGDKIVLSKFTENNGFVNVDGNFVTNYLTSDITNGKPCVFTTSSGMSTALIWGYQGSHLISETRLGKMNGDPAMQTAYSSFETNDKGNFTYAGTSITSQNTVTGNNLYQLNTGGITKTLNASQSFVVSLWASNSSVIVSKNGVPISGPSRTGATLNGLTYYEWEVVAPTSITISSAGSVNIDELRLYPKGAQMITYTYEPLVGVQSQCSETNSLIYYEYDATGRLKLIRDQEKNILKKYEYVTDAP